MRQKLFFSLFLLLVLSFNQAKNIHEDFDLRTKDDQGFKKLTHRENAKLQQTCGKIDQKLHAKRLMINKGISASRGRIPWAASFSHSDGTLNNCGATLISPRHLLTAAHCFFDYENYYVPCDGPTLIDNIDQMLILLGGVCLETNNQTGCDSSDMKQYKVRGFAVAKNFNKFKCSQGHDVAIIELAEDVQLSDEIKPVCLPTKVSAKEKLAEALQQFTDVYSFGFGKDEENDTSRLLYFNSHFDDYNLIHGENDLINAISNESNKKARICPGDSGSGLLGKNQARNQYSIIGVHSYAFDCGDENLRNKAAYSSTFIGFHLDEICKLTGVCAPQRR